MTVFLSFLGTGDYKPCRYALEADGFDSGVVKFVQTAINKMPRYSFDRRMIFCTKKAREVHWDSFVAEFRREGLPDPECIDIPEGGDMESLWRIFEVAMDVVPSSSNIVFDVTHSFRSLPVIMTILLNYLTVVKSTRTVGCYYGAFEKLGRASEIEKNFPDPRDRSVPIFDLSGFFNLNRWTEAIHEFDRFGDASSLKTLSLAELSPKFRTSDADRRLGEAVKKIELFAQCVRVSSLGVVGQRCGIVNEKMETRIRQNLDGLEQSVGFPPLNPILHRAKTIFADVRDFDTVNGYFAAEWAANHGLIPQAYTMLEETIVSVFLERCAGKLPVFPDAVKRREFASALIGFVANPHVDFARFNNPYVDRRTAEELASRLDEDFCSAYDKIRRRRNALNHGGTNPQEPVMPGAIDFRPEAFFEILKTIRAWHERFSVEDPQSCPNEN